MQRATGNPFGDRFLGVLRLDPRAYEEVEHDQSATTQALTVVVLAAIAQGIGALGGDGNDGNSFIGGIIGALLVWVLFSIVAYFVGTTLFATPNTSATIGQVLRTIGFAQAPKLLLVLGFIPVLGGLIGLVAWIWFFATSIVALRQALDFTTGRAVGTAIVALIVPFLVLLFLGILFGIGGIIFGLAF